MVWSSMPFSGRYGYICELAEMDTSPLPARGQTALALSCKLKKQGIQFLAMFLRFFVSDNVRTHYPYSPLVGRRDNQFLLNRRNDQIQNARH